MIDKFKSHTFNPIPKTYTVYSHRVWDYGHEYGSALADARWKSNFWVTSKENFRRNKVDIRRASVKCKLKVSQTISTPTFVLSVAQIMLKELKKHETDLKAEF